MYAEKTDYDDIEMSSRLRNILRRNGFESLEGLREYPKEHFIKFRNMGQATLQELYQICEEQGIKLRSVEDLNDREHGVIFDDFLCLDAFGMGIKSKYNKFDVVYADFGKNPHGIQGGIRPGIIISCDASNHDGAPQVSVVPLSSKLKDIPVHVILNPKDVSGFGLSKISDFMPEDAQTISKGCIRAKSGTVIEDSGVREEIDRALIRQFDLLPVARKMVMEELANGQQN